jgi:hypothetical protein
MATLQPLVSSFPGLAGSIPAMPFPLYVNDRTVTGAEDETVPVGAKYVVLNPDADVWMANGTGAAVVPSGDVVDGTGSILIKAGVIPPAFRVQPGQILSVISATGTAHVAFWYYSSLGQA